jgi:hypothetical protein
MLSEGKPPANKDIPLKNAYDPNKEVVMINNGLLSHSDKIAKRTPAPTKIIQYNTLF